MSSTPPLSRRRTTGSSSDWFISEQCKEEKNAKDLITKYELFAKDGGFGLYNLDNEMKARKPE